MNQSGPTVSRILGMLLAGVLFFLNASPANAEPIQDNKAPNVEKLSVTSLSMSTAERKIISYRATLSDDHFVQSASCQLAKGHESTIQAAFKKVSGTRTSGVWECKQTFPKGASAGDWLLTLKVLDATGNELSLKALTATAFESSSTVSNDKPVIRNLNGGVFTVNTSSTTRPAQTFQQPFTVTGEFGVGGYAEIWPTALANRTMTIAWYADGQLIANETASRLNLGANLSGKTLSVKLLIAKTGFRTKTIDLLAPYAVGSAIADDSSSAGWIYQDGVQHNLSRPFCFEPQAVTSLGTARVGWKVETYCPYTSSQTFGFPVSKKIYWYSNDLPEEITSQGSYRIRSTDVNRSLYMVYRQVWANGYWTAGVEKFATPISATVKASRPRVLGKVLVGRSLTADVGIWQKNVQFSYQWFRNYLPIIGASSKSYQVSAADLGKSIQVMVTGSSANYNSSTKVSLPISSGVVTAPDVQSSYNNAIATYVESGHTTVTDIYASPTVDQVSLEVDERLMQKAADFWSNQFNGSAVRVIFVSTDDAQGTWIDELFAAHPAWGSATVIRQKIQSYGCGWAYSNAGSVVQCVPNSSGFNDNDRQVMPHEYTHLVQFGWDSYNYSFSMPWMVEGMANFYGLALGVSTQPDAVQKINKSLAGHATQWDMFNGYSWASFKMLSMMENDAQDLRLFFRKGADLWTNYMIGSLFSEWSINVIGHENYSNLVKEILRARTERNDIAQTDVITLKYYGLTLDQLSLAVAPYFAQRSLQLKQAWAK